MKQNIIPIRVKNVYMPCFYVYMPGDYSDIEAGDILVSPFPKAIWRVIAAEDDHITIFPYSGGVPIDVFPDTGMVFGAVERIPDELKDRLWI